MTTLEFEFNFFQQRISTLLEKPFQWNDIEWSQLVSFSEFNWSYGKTPFSHLQFAFLMSVFYLSSIFLLQAFMKGRKALELKTFTIFHNLFLTLLSFFMCTGTIYAALLKANLQGFWVGLVCEQEAEPMHGLIWYWTYIFYLSKFYEFIDTWLLILKKKPVIFLHAWHHVIMPYVGWAGLEGKWAMALWTSTVWNSFVHVIMYTYYLLAALKINCWWKKYVTLLQISQFCTGISFTIVFFYYYFLEFSVPFLFKPGCTGELWAVLFMFSVNNSFLILFAKFYSESYKPKTQDIKKTQDLNTKTKETTKTKEKFRKED